MPDLAWLFMITTAGCVLQGDRLALDLTLAPGARAHVTTQSATKVHTMDANYAVQTQSIALADGAYLEFMPEPLIPHRRARFLVRHADHDRADGDDCSTRRSSSRAASTITPTSASAPRCCRSRSARSGPTGGAVHREAVIDPARRPMRQTGVMDTFDVLRQRRSCSRRKTRRPHPRAGRAPTSTTRTAGLRRLPAAERCRTDLQGARRRDRAGQGQGARVLGHRARGDHRDGDFRRPFSGADPGGDDEADSWSGGTACARARRSCASSTSTCAASAR
jgi:hypothetical protein